MIERIEIQVRSEMVVLHNIPYFGDCLKTVIPITAIRQQQADIEALKESLHDEINANTAFREAYGALPDEDMPTFCARIISERDKSRADIAELRAELAAAVAERDEFVRQNGNLSVRLASAIAHLAAIEAAPTVARVENMEAK